jgi:type II secretory pathway component PulF
VIAYNQSSFGVIAPMADVNTESADLKTTSAAPLRVPFVASVLAQFSGPLSAADLALFAELLVGLVRAKLPIPEALRMLARDADTPRLRASLEAVEHDVSGGMSLSEALRKRESEFPPLFTRLIDQGVESNDLHAALVELVREYRSQARFREALWGQLLSPIATTVVLGTFVFVLACSEIPRVYSGFYYRLRVGLPLATRSIIRFSEIMHNPKTAVAAAVFVFFLVFICVMVCKRPTMRRNFQLFALSLPLTGPFLKAIFLGRFCRLLGILLCRRVPLDSALELTRNSFTFIPLNDAIEAVLSRIKSGAQLDEALSACALFPPTIIEFVRGGQAHGELAETLLRLADIYEQRAEVDGTRVRFLIFLFAQLSIGLAVGVVIYSFFYPLFRYY